MFNPSQFLVKTDVCKRVGGCDERVCLEGIFFNT